MDKYEVNTHKGWAWGLFPRWETEAKEGYLPGPSLLAGGAHVEWGSSPPQSLGRVLVPLLPRISQRDSAATPRAPTKCQDGPGALEEYFI